jgi:hypothetical protein
MSEGEEWESRVHDHRTCKIKDCEACVHGLPPGCGCSNLEIYCMCCGEEYKVSALSYKPHQVCRLCECPCDNPLIIKHEKQRIQ